MKTIIILTCALMLVACGDQSKFKTWPTAPPPTKVPIKPPPAKQKQKPPLVIKQKMVPKAKVQPRVVISAAECAELADGIRLAGAARVREEAAKRNVPKWKIDAAFKQCGF